MTDINNLNKPLDRSEAGILANVDELVEMGIPRDMADRCVRLAISCCDQIFSNLDYIDAETSSLNERSLAKSLFIGGLFNWCKAKAGLAEMALLLVATHYRGN